MCCGAETRTGSTAEAAVSSDRAEQSDVMMMDQQSTQVTPVESNGSQAAVAASDASSMQPAGQSSSSQMTPQPDVTSPAVAGPAAAKSRVFKMSDEFLMFKFKIEMCSRKDRHDWKVCPYAHPGEVARRRHPRGYTAVLCPAKTAALCPRREQCTFAHNPFEFWLHPDRFKTSLCNQGPTCDRPICFFAHKDDEVRRLAHGLEAAGPDDYVYATAATPEQHGSDAGSAHPLPPPPPPRVNGLGHAGSGALGFLQGNAFAAAAAAAAAASLNSSSLLLGASPVQHYQQMMMAGGDEALLQAAGSGLLPDAASALCGSSWLNSNSDPAVLTSLNASGRQLSSTSPVPMPQPYSSAAGGGRAFRGSLPSASMLGAPIDQSAAMAAAGLSASMLAGMQGMPLSHQLNGSHVSLAGAAGMAGKAAGLAGSAPAGYSLLGNDMAESAYHQQLLQQLQMEQHHQQQQMSQQQLLQDQLVLQQQLQAMIQQQAMTAAGASSSSLQQLVQQQQAQLQLQQMAAVQQAAQQQQQWHGSMLVSQPLAASAPSSQLLWQQQQQQQQQLEASHAQPRSHGSSSSVTPPDSSLASVLGGVGSWRNSVLSPTQQMSCTAPPAYGISQQSSQQQQQQQQQGTLKWSSSVLSKRGSGHGCNSSGQGAMQRRSSLEVSSGRALAGVGLLESSGLTGAAAGGGGGGGGGGMLPPSGSTAMAANPNLDQLNGLLQMVHVSSSAMAGPGGSAY
ncbi:hypothetical protein COO60DRAFT_1697238 [Scenedesmus sp. NREL 46B-D3]|nr:hypothetical protein COO60DRAFT_1697238 [Scenedesmus sp. NREL 46B-D3]